MKKLLLLAALAAAWATAQADCVTGAKEMTQYQLINPNTTLLSNGNQTIIVHTFQLMYTPSQVIVLKNSFCSFANAVLVVGDQVINAQEVDGAQ
ncbi:MAG: hypothetical protein ACYC22_02495 [Thiomonas delicata]